jgi:ceramide glucosyltransferase
MSDLDFLVAAFSVGSLVSACGYGLLAVLSVMVWRSRSPRIPSASLEPVSLLAPLCGMEPDLYLRLRSFCTQDYPCYEVVFGVQSDEDPAILVVRRLMREFPRLKIKLVVEATFHGANRKVSNLINILLYAEHEFLVMADSDAHVAADYVAQVTAPLHRARVGLVTCLSCGVPTPHVWSRLGAMYFNDWYVPSVLISWLFGHDGYSSGQTLCIRKSTLKAIGGLEAVANQLAEDYKLGELVRNLKLRIVMSPYVLQGEHHEPSFNSLLQHELRWLRTLRVLRPRSYRWLFMSFSLPLGIAGFIGALHMGEPAPLAWVLLAVVIVTRVLLHTLWRAHSRRSWLADLWLLPLRDLLMVAVWCCSFLSTRVVWRGNVFDVHSDGVMRSIP